MVEEAGGLEGGGDGTEIVTVGVGILMAECQKSSSSILGNFWGNQRSETWAWRRGWVEMSLITLVRRALKFESTVVGDAGAQWCGLESP